MRDMIWIVPNVDEVRIYNGVVPVSSIYSDVVLRTGILDRDPIKADV